jgi:PAS domain S-box-containing protein
VKPPSDPNPDLDGNQVARALRASNSIVVITDPRQADNPIVWVNDQFCTFTGWAREQVLGRNPRFLQGAERGQPQADVLRAKVAAGEPAHVTLRNYTRDGRPYWADLLVSPVFDDAGRLVHFIGVQTDITAREAANAELQERERLIRETAENEHERVAMDLHDGLGQTLAGLRMLSATLAQRLREAGSNEADAAERVTALLGRAVAEARQMTLGLHAATATRTGLGDAIRELVHAAQMAAGASGARVVAEVEDMALDDRRQARHLFRIAQEAVHDALDRVGARQVVVALHRTPRGVLLEVSDDAAQAPPPSQRSARSAAGLEGMRYRAELVGARVEIEQPDAGGTVVRVAMPLAGANAGVDQDKQRVQSRREMDAGRRHGVG